MTYLIAELAEGEKGGFCPRGAVKTLWQTRDRETMVSGPAETGKTFGCIQYLDALLWKYPGAQAIMARKTQASLVGSALRTYKRVIGDNSPIRAYGGNSPQWFDYPNGSRLWIAGLDNAQKALSSERDLIYINQAEELTESDWETLTTRCTGRGAVMPYTRMFGDCNPAYPTHWIKAREKSGKLRLLESRHEDNPTLYAEGGEITEQGRRSLSVLDGLTGTRYLRLRKGLWVQAEGVVYEGFDPARHIIPRIPIPADWPRVWTVDFGFVNPFVWQDWATDPDGRLILVREIYRTQRLVEDHAKDIKRASGWEWKDAEGKTHPPVNPQPRPVAVICDHDAEDRATLEKHLGLTTRAAVKNVSGGIQAVAARLKLAGDNKPRLLLFDDALLEIDPLLLDAKSPVKTADEFEVYVWDTRQGMKKGDQPVKAVDHGMDPLRYRVAEDDMQVPPRPVGLPDD